MDFITIFGLTTLYIIILIIQITLLVITAKKNEAGKWKKLFVFEVISILVALILCGVFGMLLSNTKDIWDLLNDITRYGMSFYASVGATIVYGVMLVITIVVKVISNNSNKQEDRYAGD